MRLPSTFSAHTTCLSLDLPTSICNPLHHRWMSLSASLLNPRASAPGHHLAQEALKREPKVELDERTRPDHRLLRSLSLYPTAMRWVVGQFGENAPSGS